MANFFFFKIFDFFDGILFFGVCYLFKILFLMFNTFTSSLKKIFKVKVTIFDRIALFLLPEAQLTHIDSFSNFQVYCFTIFIAESDSL